MSKSIAKTRMTAFIRDNMIEAAVRTSGIAQGNHDMITKRAEFTEKVRKALLSQANFTDAIIAGVISKYKTEYPADCAASKFIDVTVRSDYTTFFNVNLNGMNLYLYFDGNRYTSGAHYWSMPDTFITDDVKKAQEDPATRRYVPRQRMDLASNDLADEFMSLEREQDALNEREKELRATLAATIKRFGTVESMLEKWPESEELLPADLKPSTGLAISVADLNSICGIPKGE